MPGRDSGYRADRSPFIYVDFSCGTWGARPYADGLEGFVDASGNLAENTTKLNWDSGPENQLAIAGGSKAMNFRAVFGTLGILGNVGTNLRY